MKLHLVALVGFVALAGCRKEDMAEQPRYDPHQPSAFFEDGNSARPLVDGTVARGGQGDSYGPHHNSAATTTPSGMHLSDANVAAADFPSDFPRGGEDLRRTLER